MRKLASIRKITEISTIPNADNIVLAQVDGWAVVVKLGQFVVGDLAVYCEIDSWIPHKIAPFLSHGPPKTYNGIEGERLKTIKLRGQLSQGLLLPLEVLDGISDSVQEDDDVTELLGITKWESQTEGAITSTSTSTSTSNFPPLVPKTDQERIQNVKHCERYAELTFEVTEKLDGSSCTFYLERKTESQEEPPAFHVCSRNIDIDISNSDDNVFWQTALKYKVETQMRTAELFGYAIQGELIGEKIQKNPYKLNGYDFYVFDIYDTNRKMYLNATERKELTEKLSLKHCPIIRTGKLLGTKAEILLEAEGSSQLCKTTVREGLVFKCLTDPSISFKAISNTFLLKQK